MANDDRFDGLLGTVASQQSDGIEGLLDSFFGFLRRRTDFFSAASEETIKATVWKKIAAHKRIADDQKNAEDKKRALAAEEAAKRKAAAEVKMAPAPTPAPAPALPPQPVSSIPSSQPVPESSQGIIFFLPFLISSISDLIFSFFCFTSI